MGWFFAFFHPFFLFVLKQCTHYIFKRLKIKMIIVKGSVPIVSAFFGFFMGSRSVMRLTKRVGGRSMFDDFPTLGKLFLPDKAFRFHNVGAAASVFGFFIFAMHYDAQRRIYCSCTNIVPNASRCNCNRKFVGNHVFL